MYPDVYETLELGSKEGKVNMEGALDGENSNVEEMDGLTEGGREDGIVVGRVEISTDGLTVGYIDGFFEGDKLKIFEGVNEGDAVGCDGLSVGFNVGDMELKVDGSCDGF